MNIVLSIGSIWLWHSCVTCVYIHVFCMSVGMMFGGCYMDYWVKWIKMFALFFLMRYLFLVQSILNVGNSVELYSLDVHCMFVVVHFVETYHGGYGMGSFSTVVILGILQYHAWFEMVEIVWIVHVCIGMVMGFRIVFGNECW